MLMLKNERTLDAVIAERYSLPAMHDDRFATKNLTQNPAAKLRDANARGHGIFLVQQSYASHLISTCLDDVGFARQM